MVDDYTLRVDVRDEASGDLQRVEREVDDLGEQTRETESSMSQFADFLGGELVGEALQGFAEVAAQAASALARMTVEQAKINREILEGAEATGASVRQYQRLRFTLQRFGVAGKKVKEALTTISERAADARRGAKGMQKNFAALGISVSDLRSKSPGELFRMVAKRIQAVESDTRAAKGAVALLGDEIGNKLLTKLRGTDKTLKQVSDRLEKLGVFLEKETIKKAAEASRKWTRLQNQFTGLKRITAAQLSPALSSVSNALAEITSPKNRQSILALTGAINAMAQSLETVANSGAAQAINSVAAQWNDLPTRLKAAIAGGVGTGAVTAGFGAIPGAIGGAIFGPSLVEGANKVDSKSAQRQQRRRARRQAAATDTGRILFGRKGVRGTPGGDPSAGAGAVQAVSKYQEQLDKVLKLEEKRQRALRRGAKIEARRLEFKKQAAKWLHEIQKIREDNVVTEAESDRLQKIQNKRLRKRRMLEKDIKNIRKQRFELTKGPAFDEGPRVVDTGPDPKAQKLSMRIKTAKRLGVPVDAINSDGEVKQSYKKKQRQEAAELAGTGDTISKDEIVQTGIKPADAPSPERRRKRAARRARTASAVSRGAAAGGQQVGKFLEQQRRLEKQVRATNRSTSAQVKLFSKLAGEVGNLAGQTMNFANAQKAAASATQSLSQIGGIASQFVKGTRKRAGVRAGFEAAAAAAATAGALAAGGAAPNLWAAAAKHALAAGLFGAVAAGAIKPQAGAGATGGGAAAGARAAGGGRPSINIDPQRQRERSAQAFAKALRQQERKERTVIKVDFGESMHVGNTTSEIERAMRKGVERDRERRVPPGGRGG